MTSAVPKLLGGAVAEGLEGLFLRLRRGAAPRPRKLTAAEQVGRDFFERAIEGIFRTTPEGCYVAANTALARIYGYDSPDLLMSELTDIAGQLYVEPGRREAFRDLLQAGDQVIDFVSEIRRRDGRHIWISENARAVRDWAGRLVFYEGTVEDVTEKIEAERALRNALREAELANEMKAAFLAAMSHELKTPLNAVLGFAEMLKGEILGPIGRPAYVDYAAHIFDSGTRLLEIINNILDITRLQAEAMTIERKQFDFLPLAREAIAQVHAAGAMVLPVAMDIASGLPMVDADPSRLKQILVHLLSNAVKFTPPNGAVTLRAWADGHNDLVIEIADTGIGMAPECIVQALEPFRQLDSSLSRRFEGTGLGLAISKSLIELHGGTLTIESSEGEGTTVQIRLPAALSCAWRATG